jgi:hypothetical protein
MLSDNPWIGAQSPRHGGSFAKNLEWVLRFATIILGKRSASKTKNDFAPVRLLETEQSRREGLNREPGRVASRSR